MTHIITRIVVTAFSLILVAQFVPGIAVDSIVTAIIAAILLGILNTLVRPVLVILTLPVTIVTLGLFIFVINAFCRRFYSGTYWLAYCEYGRNSCEPKGREIIYGISIHYSFRFPVSGFTNTYGL
jgi:Mycobacterial 4 TMS phage holin, superfamily IV